MIASFSYLKRALSVARDYNSLEYFPLLKTLSSYRLEYFGGDIRAGLNVALLAFPQGMAYALIAGLPIEYGIYGSAIAALVGPIFAKSRFITLGPTNATSILLISTFTSLSISGNDSLIMLPLLVLLTGIFIMIGAYFKVANLVQYISRSVITGYITAAALLIITNQIPKALGLELGDQRSATFFESVQLITSNLATVNVLTLCISIATATLFIFLSCKFKSFPNVAICLITLSVASSFLLDPSQNVAHLSGIDARDWSWSIPHISIDNITLLTGPALAIALMCVLEGISMGKSLAARTGSRFDANQAMFSIGTSNIACALLSGMPASGSLTRSSLSVASGGRTPVASIISGLIVMLGAFAVGPFTKHIPQCVLAVLVIAIGISLINRRTIRIVTSATRSDAIVFSLTFGSGLLLPLDSAIYIGVGASIVLFLKKVARPDMIEYTFNEKGELAEMNSQSTRQLPEVSIVHVEGELFFGAADLFRDQMRRICEDPNLKIVILKMRNAHHMDASGVMALEELVRYINEMGRYLILSEAKSDLIRVLHNAGLYEYMEARNIFMDDPENPTLSTARALKRANEHLGDTDANVSIYIDTNKESEHEQQD